MPPAPRVATGFGGGLNVAFASGAATYTITGDGLTPRVFGPADIDPAAPAGSIRYLKTVNGAPERFSIPTPSISGVPLEYTRAVTLSVTQIRPLQYLCVTGVPTRVGDTPAGSNIPFARVGFTGTAYRQEGGSQRTYSLSTSVATFAANLTNGTVTVMIDLIGVEQTPGGPVGGPIAIGTINATLDIDTSQPTYFGLLNRTTGTTLISGTMGGWFFGPQGAETGAAMSAVVDEQTRRTTIVGNLVGFQR